MLCGLGVAVTLLGLALEGVNRVTAQAATFLYPNALALALCFPVIGLVIALRRPENAIGWLFGVMGLSAAVPVLAAPYVVYVLRVNPGSLPGGAFMSWLTQWAWLPGFTLLPLLLLLFPDGRLLSRRWRPVVWAALLGMVLVTVHTAWFSWPLRGVTMLPYLAQGISVPIQGGRLLAGLGNGLLGGSAVAAIWGVAWRLRQAQGVERQQLKWFVYAIIMVAVIQIAVVALTIRYGERSDHPVMLTLVGLQTLALVGVAVAIGTAILRYRLYDIDVVINRTLVYGTLTAVLALLYGGSVTLLQQLFQPFTGGSNLAIVASTLVIAVLFNPLRGRIQTAIDRRFYRRRYDAAQTLAAFSARLRDEADLDALTSDLLAVINDTVQPAHASLWLRHKRR